MSCIWGQGAEEKEKKKRGLSNNRANLAKDFFRAGIFNI